jgi:hypothetical protein
MHAAILGDKDVHAINEHFINDNRVVPIILSGVGRNKLADLRGERRSGFEDVIRLQLCPKTGSYFFVLMFSISPRLTG